MENEIRKAFDQLQAEPQLTEDTRRYLDQEKWSPKEYTRGLYYRDVE